MARIIRVERECVKHLFLIFICAFNCLRKNSLFGDEWRGRVGFAVNTIPCVLTHLLENTARLWPAKMAQEVQREDLILLIPAFVLSQLQAGFEIGFLIYIPFIVIDLIVSNLLLALGMQMVSPMTISLPLKLLLFVMVSGWSRLLDSLFLSYL